MQSGRTVFGLISLLLLITLAVTQPQPLPQDVLENWRVVNEVGSAEGSDSRTEALQNLLKYQPWRVDLWHQLAKEALDTGDDAASVMALEHLEGIESLDAEMLFQMAELYLRNGQIDQAKQTWHGLLSQDDLSEDMYLELVRYQRLEGNFDFAREAAQGWVMQYPTSGKANYYAGLVHLAADPDRAMIWLQAAGSLDPVYQTRSIKLVDAAETAKRNEDQAYQLVVIGRALAYIESWDLAEEAMNRAVHLAPQAAEAWALLSQVQQKLGRDAAPALEYALKLSPDSTIVRSSAAAYWRSQGQPDKALEYLQSLAEEQPLLGIWQVELGATYQMMGKLDIALNHYLNAVELEPENPSVWQSLAAYCFHTGIQVQDLGIPSARTALQLDPQNADLQSLMGWGLLTSGDLVNAEQFLRKAIELDPGNATAFYYLGVLYLQGQKTGDANQAFKRAVEFSEGGSIGWMAARLLDEMEK